MLCVESLLSLLTIDIVFLDVNGVSFMHVGVLLFRSFCLCSSSTALRGFKVVDELSGPQFVAALFELSFMQLLPLRFLWFGFSHCQSDVSACD